MRKLVGLIMAVFCLMCTECMSQSLFPNNIYTLQQLEDSDFYLSLNDTLLSYNGFTILTSSPVLYRASILQEGDTVSDIIVIAKNDTIYGYCRRNYTVRKNYRKMLVNAGHQRAVNRKECSKLFIGLKKDFGISLKPKDVLTNHVDKVSNNFSDRAQPFSTWLCGFAGVQPDLSYKFEAKTKVNGLKAARKWLHSSRYVKRCYAIDYLHNQMLDNKYKPTAGDWNHIYKTKFSAQKIVVCSGCFSGTQEVRKVLSKYDFINHKLRN